jgi:hypothetical protein
VTWKQRIAATAAATVAWFGGMALAPAEGFANHWPASSTDPTYCFNAYAAAYNNSYQRYNDCVVSVAYLNWGYGPMATVQARGTACNGPTGGLGTVRNWRVTFYPLAHSYSAYHLYYDIVTISAYNGICR